MKSLTLVSSALFILVISACGGKGGTGSNGNPAPSHTVDEATSDYKVMKTKEKAMGDAGCSIERESAEEPAKLHCGPGDRKEQLATMIDYRDGLKNFLEKYNSAVVHFDDGDRPLSDATKVEYRARLEVMNQRISETQKVTDHEEISVPTISVADKPIITEESFSQDLSALRKAVSGAKAVGCIYSGDVASEGKFVCSHAKGEARDLQRKQLQVVFDVSTSIENRYKDSPVASGVEDSANFLILEASDANTAATKALFLFTVASKDKGKKFN